MKKVFVLGVLCLMCAACTNNDFKSKFEEAGCSSEDIDVILNKVNLDDYDKVLNMTCSSDLMNILNSKDYKADNFSKYVSYYDKNKDSNMADIITIVNSGYDLMDYKASSLLASLVSEKYFIVDNVSRYLDYGNKNNLSSKKIISLVNANVDYGFYNKDFETDVTKDNLVLVNKFYHLPSGYTPSDLVTLTSDYNKGINSKMRKEAAEAFMEMVSGAKLDNIILKNASAYRSFDYQVTLYNNYVKRDGKKNADIYSARPGYSEHQTGLCADINIIDSSFDNTKEAKWLSKNAYKYGFILRFPKDKEDITGYKYESWHYRYVGKEAAKIIYDNDLTLEEYYAYYVK